jgi:hypothetical protein
MKQPIFVYYQLDNFYQNHRRSVVCLISDLFFIDIEINKMIIS